MAETFKVCGQNKYSVRCLLAQARIEIGEITAAIEDLTNLKEELEEEKAKPDQIPVEIEEIEYNFGETINCVTLLQS